MWQLAKDTFSRWSNADAMRLSAALAYYTVFSLAPLLVVMIAIASLVFGRQAAQGQIAAQLQRVVGGRGAEAIQTLLGNAHQTGGGVIATIIGFGVLLFGASVVFMQLRSSLNKIWNVERAEPGGAAGWVRKRLFAFLLVLAVGILLLATLLITAFLSAAVRMFSDVLPLPGSAMQFLSALLSLGIATVIFALLYKGVPDAEIRWRDVWVGAIVTAVLFTIGEFFISMYLGRAAVGSAYGAAGSLVVLLAWLYYSALVFFLGAAFTRVWAERHGLRPDLDRERPPERRPRAA